MKISANNRWKTDFFYVVVGALCAVFALNWMTFIYNGISMEVIRFNNKTNKILHNGKSNWTEIMMMEKDGCARRRKCKWRNEYNENRMIEKLVEVGKLYCFAGGFINGIIASGYTFRFLPFFFLSFFFAN